MSSLPSGGLARSCNDMRKAHVARVKSMSHVHIAAKNKLFEFHSSARAWRDELSGLPQLSHLNNPTASTLKPYISSAMIRSHLKRLLPRFLALLCLSAVPAMAETTPAATPAATPSSADEAIWLRVKGDQIVTSPLSEGEKNHSSRLGSAIAAMSSSKPRTTR